MARHPSMLLDSWINYASPAENRTQMTALEDGMRSSIRSTGFVGVYVFLRFRFSLSIRSTALHCVLQYATGGGCHVEASWWPTCSTCLQLGHPAFTSSLHWIVPLLSQSLPKWMPSLWAAAFGTFNYATAVLCASQSLTQPARNVTPSAISTPTSAQVQWTQQIERRCHAPRL